MKKGTIIALTLLAAGAVCCLAAVGVGLKNGAFRGGLSSLHQTVNNQTVAPTTDNTVKPATGSAADNTSQTTNSATDSTAAQTLDQNATISRVELDIDNAEFIVKKGETNSLAGADNVRYQQRGDTLQISQEHRSWDNPPQITLTLKDATLTDLDIELDAGWLTVSDITVTRSMECSVDVGNAQFQNVSAQRLDLDVDTGKIEFAGKTLGPVQLECDSGKIDMNLTDSTVGRVTGEMDGGRLDVQVNGQQAFENHGRINRISQDLSGATGSDTLNVDCDAGNISVKLTTK